LSDYSKIFSFNLSSVNSLCIEWMKANNE
jgi:hypothetical protein